MRRKPPDTREDGLRPARRAEVALLFFAAEGRQVNTDRDFGRRIEPRWPYYFLQRRGGQLNTDRDFGRRVEQRWPYYFLRRRGGQLNTRSDFGRHVEQR